MQLKSSKEVSSYSKTTKEDSAQRIQDLAHAIARPSGIPQQGAQIIAQLVVTLEVRITDLEAALERKGRK
jgi:hypothetical protein